MKQMVRRLARSGGLYVTRYPPPETLAFHLKQLTRRLEINCVLDVGAHQGGYARLLRKEIDFGRWPATRAGAGTATRWAGRRGGRP